MISFVRRRAHLLIWLLVALVAAVAVGFAALLIMSSGQAAGPQVQLLQVVPDDPAYAQQTVLVRAAASDPAGVQQVELWVNGDRVTVRQLEGQPTESSVLQAWYPTVAGVYSLSVRAVNTEGRAGESPPAALQVEARDFGAEPGTPTQVIMTESLSPDEFEERYGFAPSEAEGSSDDGSLAEGDSLLGPSAEEDYEDEPEVDEPPEDVPMTLWKPAFK